MPEQELDGILERYLAWSDRVELKSVDWWDIWAMRPGRWSKLAYVRKNPLGYGGVALLTGVDLFLPGIRSLFFEKRTFPICHAHTAMGFLNLWAVSREEQWLRRAEALVEPLLAMASPRASGLGWGMKHEWTTIGGVIPSDTPCNTQTAYPYELFRALDKATGDPRYREYLDRIAHHVANDFREWRNGDRLTASYSTIDHFHVVNANSYRMMMLVDSGVRTGNEMYLEKGTATVRYVLSMQKSDGSWPYSEHQDFVDTYHTCFVLKNLMKTARSLGGRQPEIEEAVRRGLDYFTARHFDADGYPVPFSVEPRLTLQKYDSYDLAETIGLLAPMPDQRQRVEHLIRFAGERFQSPEGWFQFRIYAGGLIRGIPFLRHANSAMFLALTQAKRSFCTDAGAHGE